MADERAQLAVAAFALDATLAPVSSVEGDLVAGSDSSVHVLANVGSAVACTVGTRSFDVADVRVASGATLTWWNATPQPGDSVAMLDEGGAPGASDDRWHRDVLLGASPRTASCLHSGYVDSIADAASVGWRLTTAATIPPTVRAGAIVRVVRPQRFALYRASGEWMLGWTEWNPATTAWNTIQPVAGPLLPYAPPGATSGFAIRWVDSTGNAVAPSSGARAAAAILTLGATTRDQVRIDGVRRGARRDSLTVRLTLRNAR